METLIIYAHPYEKSFNSHVLEKIKGILNKKNQSFSVIDLNEDGFNPVMTKADLRLFSRGEYADPLALDYSNRLKAADEVIFIFPIWWYGLPAILKGFLDKVLLKGHAYEEVDYQMSGLLKGKKALVLTTSTITEDFFKYLGDPINNWFIKGTLNYVGIADVKWLNCPTIYDEAARNNFLEEIDKVFA